MDEDWLHRLALMHDKLVETLVPIWNTLPAGAVHGDLGIYNNLMQTKYGLGIIDFNRSGDEVFLGDALSAFYASVHKLSWQERLSAISKDEALHVFLSGYGSQRILTTVETEYYHLVAALFDGLFYCKSAIELWNIGDWNGAVKNMRMGDMHFDPDMHAVPQYRLEGCKYDDTAN